MRKLKEKPPCAALPQCNRLSSKLGYCEAHYQQLRRGLPFTEVQPKSRNLGKSCAYPSCGSLAIKVGYCSAHYQQKRSGRSLEPAQSNGRPLRTCSFPGCDRPHEARGYCGGHFQQYRSAKPLVPLQVIRDTCTYPGCDHPHEARGYCHGHYDLLKSGLPLRPLFDTPSPVEQVGSEWRVILFKNDVNGGHGLVAGYAVISEEDVTKVGGLRWNLTPQGYARSARRQDKRGVLMHRFVTGAYPNVEVDHINGNRLDNRRENLRFVNDAQQGQNRKVRCNSSVGVRGVSYDSKKRLYRALVTVKGVKFSGGRHKRREDADQAAVKLRTELMTHTNEEREDYRKR